MEGMTSRPLAIAALLLASVVPAASQQSVRLEFSGGRVTLSARNVPVRAILAEWARVGGATIVNADRIVGPAVSLELNGVPERQAIDVVLRGVAGYMIAPRPTGSTGASAFDRIVVLPTSSAPAPPPPPAAAVRQPPRPPIIVRPPVEAEAPAIVEGEGLEATEEPQEDSSAPGQPGRQIDRRTVRPPIVLGQNDDQPDQGSADPNDTEPAVTTTPSNPFGIPAGSSATPGVIAPQRGGAQRPGTTTRVQ
jgi:hypothetical protein